jgi:sugar/nucleoside kinase (ribokinase family)
MFSSYDVLGLGCVAIDDLLYVAAYPPADGKVQVQRRERQCGGLTATALVAAARLGSQCVYAGILGDDDLSQFVVDRLGKEGIDTRLVRRRVEARPIHSVVIVDEGRGTRTILYDLHNVYGAQADWPDEQVIRAARVLFVDHFGVEGMTRAARLAQDAGIPVVADFESDQGPGFPQLLELVDHLIISEEFARRLTGAPNAPRAAESLFSDNRNTVVVTCGAEGCWFVTEPPWDSATHAPAFSVRVVDTTGCGDVFHGAYASALARGLAITDRLRFASAAAALKATRRGGQAGIPTRTAVEAFLKEQEPWTLD